MFYPYSLLYAHVNLSRFQVQAGEKRRKGKRKENENVKGGKGENRSQAVSASSPPLPFRVARPRPPPLPAVRIPRGAASRGAAEATARTGRSSRRLKLLPLAGRLRRGRPRARRDPRGRPLVPMPARWCLPPLSRLDPAALPHRPPAPSRSALRMRAPAPHSAAASDGRRPRPDGALPPQVGRDRRIKRGQVVQDTGTEDVRLEAQGRARGWQYAGPRTINPCH